MVGYTGVVRARAAKERPAIDNELTAAQGAQIRRSKATRRSAANENRVKFPPVIIVDIPDRPGTAGRLKRLLDFRFPLFDCQEGRTGSFRHALIHCSPPLRSASWHVKSAFHKRICAY